jgi:DivIVA domain-containing protein
LALDRKDIQRDFPTGRRGYDRAAVDAHLRAVADEVEAMAKAADPAAAVAAAAGEQVRQIVQAAEAGAAEIRRTAESEAREHVTRVGRASQALLERLDALESELGTLVEGVRSGAKRLVADLAQLESQVGELRSSADAVGGAEPRAPAPAAEELDELTSRSVDAEPDEESAAAPAAARPGAEPEGQEAKQAAAAQPAAAAAAAARPESEPAGQDAKPAAAAQPPAAAADATQPAAEGKGKGPASRDADAEGARLIALNMALNGTPREETGRYLAENFELPDRDALLDEVYARVGA